VKPNMMIENMMKNRNRSKEHAETVSRMLSMRGTLRQGRCKQALELISEHALP